MASSSSSSKTTRKAGKGRRKIEIKKVEQNSNRLVTFSKRKLGLFRKAAELSLLCDSQIAVIVFSQLGKVFTSGYPDPDAVIHRYLSGPASSSFSDPTPVHDPERESAPLRREFEEAMKVLEKEKKFVNADTDRLGCGHGLWWNRSIEEMSLDEVMQFKECVEQLRQNVAATAEEKKKSTWLIDSLSPPVTMTEEKKSTWLIDSQSPPMVTKPEEKKSTWLIDSELPLPVTTAEEKKCTWLMDSQSPPVTTAEEKNSAWPIHSQSPLRVTTAEGEKCTWLNDTQSPPWSTADQSTYLSMFDDMLEIDQTWESWNASDSCDSIFPYSSDLGQNWL